MRVQDTENKYMVYMLAKCFQVVMVRILMLGYGLIDIDGNPYSYELIGIAI